MKKILIPTDFSDNALNAVNYAIKLFKGRPAELHIVHIVEPDIPPADIPGASADLYQVMMENAKNAMQELEQHIEENFDKATYSNVKIKTSIDVGAVHKTTKQLAKELEIDLIIMGSRGKNHDVFDRTLGTASTNVIEMATCPVLLIPSGYPYVNIDNVLFTTNLDHGDPFELWRAIQLLDHHGIIIRCLYVAKNEDEKDKKEVREFGKYLVEHSPGVQTVFNVEVGDDIEEMVDDYADNYDAEIVIMHRSKKSFMQKIFGVSHTKKIAKTLKYPLMVIN